MGDGVEWKRKRDVWVGEWVNGYNEMWYVVCGFFLWGDSCCKGKIYARGLMC